MRRITYRKAAAVAMAAALSAALLVGCGSTAASTDSAAASTVAAESTAEDAEKTADEGDADEVAAKNCADLIDAIYVQERSARAVSGRVPLLAQGTVWLFGCLEQGVERPVLEPRLYRLGTNRKPCPAGGKCRAGPCAGLEALCQ